MGHAGGRCRQLGARARGVAEHRRAEQAARRRWGVGVRKARGRRGARRGERHCSCNTAMLACDTAGPRATIRPLCVPGRACARLGVLN